MYGLPKVHKVDVPLRPILSANNTPTYNLAKYLVSILTPFTCNEYTIKNSFEFAREVTSINNSNSCHMCSFDVQSLFTQIPLAETINIMIDLVFENNQHFHSFNRNNLKNY